MLFQHDPDQPIGVWQEIREDSRGLFVRGQLMSEIGKAREVLALMRAGALDGLSIGFKTVQGQRDGRTGVRRLSKIDLWEVSVVTFPMQPDARVETVKAGPFAGRKPSKREMERWLTRDAGLSRTEARGLMHAGFKGMSTWRDAGDGNVAVAQLVARMKTIADAMRGT